MHPSVRAFFRKFNEPFEGAIPFMYLDVKALVTVGVGNLIDPVEFALALPFRFKNKPGVARPGQLATKAEITDEWNRLKGNRALAAAGHRACEPITNLELDNAAIDDLIGSHLADDEKFLKTVKQFRAFEDWPADAQLGLLSMSWAMGSGGPGGFKNFRGACEKLDFVTAAKECSMDERGNPGLAPRNKANRILFSNAAVVMASRGAFLLGNLNYPTALGQQAAGAGGR